MKVSMPQDQNIVRMLIIGAAFLTVTLALILMQPSTQELAEAPSNTDVILASTPAEAPIASREDDTAITRAATNLTGIATPEDASASDTIAASILKALGSQKSSAEPMPTELQTSGNYDDLRLMTSSIVASLSGAAPQRPKSQTMEEIIVQALKQGQSDAYIDALLNEAANTGQINVPSALTTNEGRVDTPTLLAALVAKSTTGSASSAPSGPIEQMDGVEVRVVQRAGETKQYNFYTVQKGDSLGAIARRFYGDATAYTLIFEANRTFLSTPDQIRVGQRLSIPAANSI